MALEIIALIFSFASVLITAITLNNQKTDLEFYTEEEQNQSNSGYVVEGKNCFINDGEPHNYIETETFLFVKVHIANKSHIPCTINLFKLYMPNGTEYEYKHHRIIPDNFCIFLKDKDFNYITNDRIITPICTIPPLGYVDGYVFFPVKEKLKGRQIVKPSATLFLINSKGDKKPKHLRGLLLINETTASNLSWGRLRKSVPLGKKKRIKPLMFSLLPLCHGE